MGWASYFEDLCEREPDESVAAAGSRLGRPLKRRSISRRSVSRQPVSRVDRNKIRMELAVLKARLHPTRVPKPDRKLEQRKALSKRITVLRAESARKKAKAEPKKTKFLKSIARHQAVTNPTLGKTESPINAQLALMVRLPDIARKLAIKMKQDNWIQLSHQMDQLEFEANRLNDTEFVDSEDHSLEQLPTLPKRLEALVNRGRAILLDVANIADNFLADPASVSSRGEIRRLSPFRRALDHQVTQLRDGWRALKNQVDALEARGAELRSKFVRHAIWGTVKANVRQTLGEIAENIAPGIRTSIHRVYVLDKVLRPANTYFSHFLGRSVELEPELVHAFLCAEDISRYEVRASTRVVIIPYELEGTKQGKPITKRKLQSLRKTWAYLKECGDVLVSRESGQMVDDGWYGFTSPKNLALFNAPKILVPDEVQSPRFAIDSKGTAAFVSAYAITLPSKQLWYLLGLLNSGLVGAFLKNVSNPPRGGYYRLSPQLISKIPIKKPESATDISLASQIGTAAKAITKIKSKLQRTKLSGRALRSLEDEADAYERSIDELVLRLYDIDRVPT